MIPNIPEFDKSDIAAWALAQSYYAMRKAEEAAASYKLNLELMATSQPGDRSVPRAEDLRTLASDEQMYRDRAEMYATMFVALETANSSPRRLTYQHTLRRVDALLQPEKIPGQRVPAAN